MSIETISRRLQAATSAPWTWTAGADAGYPQHVQGNNDGLVLIAETYDGDPDGPPVHADLIAHAPTDLAAAVEVAVKSTKAIEALLRVLAARGPSLAPEVEKDVQDYVDAMNTLQALP